MNINSHVEVLSNPVFILFILSSLAILYVVFVYFSNMIYNKKIKQEKELDEIVASVLKDVNENYI